MFKVIPTRCNCPHKTCCCDPWTVIDIENSEVFATVYSKKSADKACAILNKMEALDAS